MWPLPQNLSSSAASLDIGTGSSVTISQNNATSLALLEEDELERVMSSGGSQEEGGGGGGGGGLSGGDGERNFSNLGIWNPELWQIGLQVRVLGMDLRNWNWVFLDCFWGFVFRF